MSINNLSTNMILGDSLKETTPTYNKLSISQVVEPEFVASVYPQKETLVKTTNVIEQPVTKETGIASEPSATSDETKIYIGGGTTPESPILVKKPMTKYYLNGVVAVLAVLVAYKLFFNKK